MTRRPQPDPLHRVPVLIDTRALVALANRHDLLIRSHHTIARMADGTTLSIQSSLHVIWVQTTFTLELLQRDIDRVNSPIIQRGLNTVSPMAVHPPLWP